MLHRHTGHDKSTGSDGVDKSQSPAFTLKRPCEISSQKRRWRTSMVDCSIWYAAPLHPIDRSSAEMCPEPGPISMKYPGFIALKRSLRYINCNNVPGGRMGK